MRKIENIEISTFSEIPNRFTANMRAFEVTRIITPTTTPQFGQPQSPNRQSPSRQRTPFKLSESPSPQSPFARSRNQAISRSAPKFNLLSASKLVDVSSILASNEPPRRLLKDASPKSSVSLDNYQKNERIVEEFLTDPAYRELHERVEALIKAELSAEEVTFWQDIPSLHMLYSPRRKMTAAHNEGLIGQTFFLRDRIIVEKPQKHPSYSERVDMPETSMPCVMLYFPLWDHMGSICAVVQVVRSSLMPFNVEKELAFLDYFVRKFSVFSRFVDPPVQVDASVLALMRCTELLPFLSAFQNEMRTLCGCRWVEIWKHESDTVTVYTATGKKSGELSGIVGDALSRSSPVNCIENRMMSAYNDQVDGTEIESVLVIPVAEPRDPKSYAIVLRGARETPVFTQRHEKIVKKIAPYVVLLLNNFDA